MSNDLTTIITGMDMATVFAGGGETIDPIIARIEKEVRSHAPDLTTAKGRDAIASLAHKVSRSKKLLDDAGKKLNEDKRRQISIVDAERRKIRERLDALRDETRKPLTVWEEQQAEKKRRADEILGLMRSHGMTAENSPDEITAAAKSIAEIEINADIFGAGIEIATNLRETTLEHLRGVYAAAKQREDDAAELAKLRAEAQARADAEAKAAAAKAEAERAKAEQEQKEAAKAAEAERLEKAKAEASEKARQQAAKEAAEKEAEYKRKLAEADARAKQAAQDERNRLAAAKQSAIDAERKRAADAAHRENIKADISSALKSMSGNASPDEIADALMSGKIPHCIVRM